MAEGFTPKQMSQLAQLMTMAIKKEQAPQQHHHKKIVKTVVVEESSSDDDNVEVVEKVVSKAEGTKYQTVKLDLEEDEARPQCDCKCRDKKLCEKDAYYEVIGHPEYDLACPQHAKILRNGGVIGEKPKKKKDLCQGQTKKKEDCNNFATKDGFCSVHQKQRK